MIPKLGFLIPNTDRCDDGELKSRHPNLHKSSIFRHSHITETRFAEEYPIKPLSRCKVTTHLDVDLGQTEN